ncbi:hypothetical protein PGT21_036173 [Puccinia graminis f. sp. tritici]|uniref:Uncharacterized protein n=1 Tax=Puccinia graminis f. sp. tritici TaxID=56615 RepID=A0A5B0PB53_PUCGR|nr:hypothetical protein PGT21_036173 [Puccinia graminis f. sp. tritici]
MRVPAEGISEHIIPQLLTLIFGRLTFDNLVPSHPSVIDIGSSSSTPSLDFRRSWLDDRFLSYINRFSFSADTQPRISLIDIQRTLSHLFIGGDAVDPSNSTPQATSVCQPNRAAYCLVFHCRIPATALGIPLRSRLTGADGTAVTDLQETSLIDDASPASLWEDHCRPQLSILSLLNLDLITNTTDLFNSVVIATVVNPSTATIARSITAAISKTSGPIIGPLVDQYGFSHIRFWVLTRVWVFRDSAIKIAYPSAYFILGLIQLAYSL